MKIDIIDQILKTENFYWAFDKVKKAYRTEDNWYDELELAEFEASFNEQIVSIRKDITRGAYRTKPIRPIPFPKGKDKEEKPVIRHLFWLAIRDQVTWMAILNVAGKYIEAKLPVWSYGNRLYRAAWYEVKPVKGELKKKLKLGPFSNSSGFIFRKWNQSWPLYRRHISLATRIMANPDAPEIDDEHELNILDQEKELPVKNRLSFLNAKYWPEGKREKIYWAGIDLRNYYYSVNPYMIIKNLDDALKETGKFNISSLNELSVLAERLLRFEISDDYSPEKLTDPKQFNWTGSRNLFSLPIGLLAAGFLANLGFLHIDLEIDKYIRKDKRLAIFKFVDDHVILGLECEAITKFLVFFEELTDREEININLNKLEPESLKEYLLAVKAKEEVRIAKAFSQAQKDCAVDPLFPSPLMTKTMAKLSAVGQLEFGLLSGNEKKAVLSDLEHLLVSDFESEVRADTRVSFAATRITTFAAELQPELPELALLEEKKRQLEIKIRDLKKEKRSYGRNTKSESLVREEIGAKETELKAHIAEQKREFKESTNKITKREKRFFQLLLKALEEHPEKVKLWKKAVVYCSKTGFDHLDLIFDLLQRLESDKKIHSLSAELIRAYLMRVLGNLALENCFTLRDEQAGLWNYYKANVFFKNILNVNLLGRLFTAAADESYFLVQSRIELRFVLGTCLYLCPQQPSSIYKYPFIPSHGWRKSLLKYINKFGLINWAAEPIKWIEKNARDKGNLLLWMLVIRRPLQIENDFTQIWLKWRDHLKEKLPSDSAGWALLSLFPRDLTPSIHTSILRAASNNRLAKRYLDEEGWFNEVEEITIQARRAKKIDLLEDNECDLIEWGRKLKDLEHRSGERNFFFDPRASEWTALEITRQIARLIKMNKPGKRKKALNDIYSKIHPSNYIIPPIWLKGIEAGPSHTWTEWQKLVRRSKNHIRIVNRKPLLHDERYIPVINKDDVQYALLSGRDFPAMMALTGILVRLLMKDFRLPPLLNPIGYRMAWLNLLKRELEECPVSSQTLSMISAIYSKKYIEAFSDDVIAVAEKIKLKTLKDYIKYLEACQEALIEYQTNLKLRSPRQLIPIRLEELTKSYNPFVSPNS